MEICSRIIAFVALAFCYMAFCGGAYAYTADDARRIEAAAKAGDAKASFELGKLYHRGDGVTKDDAQALLWFMQAAKQGSPKAQVEVGKLYYTGNGTPKDYLQSSAWLRIAYEQGDNDASIYLHKLSKVMSQDQIKTARKMANEWMKQNASVLHRVSHPPQATGTIPQAPASGVQDGSSPECIKIMTDFALKNNVEPAKYIADNQAWLQKCMAAQSH